MQCCWSWWELGDGKRTSQGTLSFPLHKSQFLTGTSEQKNKLALQHFFSVPVAVFYFSISFVVAYEYHTCTWYCTWSKNLMIDPYFWSHVWARVHGYYVLLHPWLSVVWWYSTMPKRSMNYSTVWNPTTVPKGMNIHGPRVWLPSTVICQCVSVYFTGLSQEKWWFKLTLLLLNSSHSQSELRVPSVLFWHAVSFLYGALALFSLF